MAITWGARWFGLDALAAAAAGSAVAAAIVAVAGVLTAPTTGTLVQPQSNDWNSVNSAIDAWIGVAARNELITEMVSEGLNTNQITNIFLGMISVGQMLEQQRAQTTNDAIARANQWTNIEANVAQSNLYAAEQNITNTVNADMAALQGQINTTIRAIEGQLGAAQAQTWQALDSLRTALDNEVRGISQGIETQIIGLEHVTEISLQNVATTLQRDIVQSQQGIEAQIGAQGKALQDQSAAGDAAVLGVIGAAVLPVINALTGSIASVASDVTTWRQKCGDPLCNNLSNFGNVIGALEALGMDALMIAAIIALLNDPHGVASEVESIVGGVMFGAYDAVAGLVGAPKVA